MTLFKFAMLLSFTILPEKKLFSEEQCRLWKFRNWAHWMSLLWELFFHTCAKFQFQKQLVNWTGLTMKFLMCQTCRAVHISWPHGTLYLEALLAPFTFVTILAWGPAFLRTFHPISTMVFSYTSGRGWTLKVHTLRCTKWVLDSQSTIHHSNQTDG